MARPRVAITRPALPGEAIRRLADVAVVREWESRRPPTRAELTRLVSGIEGLICMSSERIDEEFLSTCPTLRVVSNLGVGFDNFDIGALTRRRIPAGNTPGVLAETTADLAWALILAAARRVTEAERVLRAGGWKSMDFDFMLGTDVFGATLGIFGYGAIGKAVARRAQGFGMRVNHYSRTKSSDGFSTWTPLSTLLAMSDIVTVHVPLTPETRQAMGQREFEQMKRSAIFVNTSRGAVVDQTALVRALRSGVIRAAGLDVYEQEPLSPEDPLLELHNCVLLPHIGSASASTRSRMVDLAVSNVVAGLKGETLPHCVNPDVYS